MSCRDLGDRAQNPCGFRAQYSDNPMQRHWLAHLCSARRSVDRGAKKYLRHKCSLITTNQRWLVSLVTCSRMSAKALALSIPALLSWFMLAFSPCCLMVARWLLHFQASHLTCKLRRKLQMKLKKNFFFPEGLLPPEYFFSCPLAILVLGPSLSSSHLVEVCCCWEGCGGGAAMSTFP